MKGILKILLLRWRKILREKSSLELIFFFFFSCWCSHEKLRNVDQVGDDTENPNK